MSEQGAPPQQRPEDGWWRLVYAGPADTLPDTPQAAPGAETVDDWFDSAVGMIGTQRGAEEPPAAPPADPASTVDEWFDSAVGMIGAQRSHDPQDAAPAAPEPRAAAPELRATAPAAPSAEPVAAVAEAPEPPAEPPAAPAPEPSAAAREPEPEAVAEPQPEPAAVEPAPPEPAAPLPPLRRPRTDAPVPHVGERPPTYSPEPTALPAVAPEALATVVPDTVLDGAQYGNATLRAVSIRGDSARFRGEPRRDALLVTRFEDDEGGLLLAILAGPGRGESAADGSAAAGEAARQLAAAIGRSRGELSADLRAGARDRLRYGLQRLTARAALPLRTAAEADGLPDAVPGSLHCLLVSLDPAATHRAAFGTGPGGLYLLRSGHWIDAYAARLLHHPDGEPPLPPGPAATPHPFRFRLVPATPGDILMLCTPGLAEPVAEEPAVAHFLANHWAHPHPPGMVDFLRQVQVRAKGYSDDRTAVALWTE